MLNQSEILMKEEANLLATFFANGPYGSDWKAEGTNIFKYFSYPCTRNITQSLKIACAGGRKAVLVYHMPQYFYFVWRAKNPTSFIL
jgi:hypothetical protein